MENRPVFTYRPAQAQDVLYPPKGTGWENPDGGFPTRDELISSNKELEQFAFAVAHDLQEPLQTISTYLELFKRRQAGKFDAREDEMISYLLEGTARMKKLIQSTLHYAQAGQGNVQLKAVDSKVVISHALENLKASIDATSARITHADCPIIRANKIQMTQVIQNLISNAIKFRHSHDSPCIHISATVQGNQCLFCVKDNGIGIEKEHVNGVFEIFKRLHGQDEYEGSGIGLALCKKIVEAHGGKIWVESEIGQGTAVYFTIPSMR